MLCYCLAVCKPVAAIDWSVNELHFQHADYDDAYIDSDTVKTVITFQHASGWKYGSHFLFIDTILADDETDFYGEFYTTLSLAKTTGLNLPVPALQDVGIVMGLNTARNANVLKYLPGISLSWDLPGFRFLTTTLTAFIDDSKGRPVPKETDSWMIDFAFDYPFSVAAQDFTITGHAEYIHERENAFGRTVESWILAQPQIRWDAGKSLFGHADSIFLGIEYQYWMNKLGDPDTDEHTVQLLAVWRF